MTDAEYVRDMRARSGMKQTEFAVAVGCSACHLSRVENGHGPLTEKMRKRIEAAFPALASPGEEQAQAAAEQPWPDAAVDFAVRVLMESGWLERHDKAITLDLAHRQQQRIPIIPDGWTSIVDRKPETPGRYRVKGYTRSGHAYDGVALLYADGYWYTLRGNRMPAPDCWKDLAHDIQTVRY